MEKNYLSGLERKFSFDEKDIVSTRGTKSNIYRTIEPGRVAKIMKQWFSEDPSVKSLISDEKAVRKLEKDFLMGKEAYKKGLNVPELEGIYMVKEINTKKEFPGFVLEYLNGNTVKHIINNKVGDYKKVRELWLKETEKAKRYFEERDFTDNSNAIYIPEKDKIYLIDFMDWKFKK